MSSLRKKCDVGKILLNTRWKILCLQCCGRWYFPKLLACNSLSLPTCSSHDVSPTLSPLKDGSKFPLVELGDDTMWLLRLDHRRQHSFCEPSHHTMRKLKQPYGEAKAKFTCTSWQPQLKSLKTSTSTARQASESSDYSTPLSLIHLQPLRLSS